jgi:hypothetical protein
MNDCGRQGLQGHGGGRGFKSRPGRKGFGVVLVKGRCQSLVWLGSSVGTSERLKIVRSPVRSRPKPQKFCVCFNSKKY